MNLETLINDKIGRKQLIAIVAIVSLANEPYLLAGVALAAILTQAVLDWKHPRANGEKNVGTNP